MIISLDLELFKVSLLAEAQVEIKCSSDGIL
jgi:hypothetical protein